LLFCSKNIGAFKYLRNISNGHESLLILPTVWDNNEYFRWCLRNFIEGKTSNFKTPIQECDFWDQIKKYIEQIKNGIENSRGWELLWNDNSPRDEKSVQVYFDNQLRIVCETTCASFSREVETGRGPIDFIFSNGFKYKYLIEIKLATNKALSNGDFCAQVYEYLKGLAADTAFLVVVGYYEEHNEIMDKVNEYIGHFHEKYSQFFIYVIYINAQRRVGASKATYTNLKDN